MPRLQSSADDWTVFSNYRSAAPMTAASLRAILSSQYLQLGSNENLINDSVQSFLEVDVCRGIYRTSLLTGADMRWHYLDNVTQAHTHVTSSCTSMPLIKRPERNIFCVIGSMDL